MADNDIIDFYKKAENDGIPEEPLKEQVETPEPVVSEAVVIPVPESNDPFDKFLFNLAEKLKSEKKITEQQQLKFNERVVQPTTDPEDPFAKFLESFAGLVKEDENINKEENIKEATIDFINKLKNDDFFDYKKEEPKVRVQPKPKKKPKKYLPPKFAKKIEKVEEEQPVVEQSVEPEPQQEDKQSEPSNPYLKELQTSDKKKNKIEDKISGLSDIKKIIAQQVQEQLSKYPNLGFTGGGGGTNAVQYAEGGTMNGNLTVNGTVNATTYLSGGTNLLNILSSSGGGGGGYADRFVSGPSQFILDPDGKLHPLDTDLLTLQSENAALSAYTRIVLSPYGFFAYDNNSNSITFDSVTDDIVITSQDLYEWTFNSEGKLVGPSGTLAVSGNVDVTNKFLSGGVDLADIFITSAEESQTLSYSESAERLSIARGNSISLSSLSDKSYVNSNFLKLSGGTITGNLTVQGNISALGSATFANTIFTTTSALSVVNTGPGPALYVYQAAGPYDVASFYDGDGIEVLHVGNAGPGGLGKVGVNESFPNKELTVRGSISATESVFATSILLGNSDLKDIFLAQQNAKFLPLSGGTLTGNTYVSSSNTEDIDLYRTAISAVQIYTDTQGSPILLRDLNLFNGQPSYSLPTFPGESWGLSWDGSQWNLGYSPVGGIATLANLDLTQGTWNVNPGNYFGITDVNTQDIQYGTSNYITRTASDSLYINRGGDTVAGNYTINGTVNVNNDFTADTIYVEPNTAVTNDGLLTFKDTNGNNKWQIKSTDYSGFSIVDLLDSPSPNQFLLGSNGSLQLTWYDAAHTNNIFFDPTQGKISITYLDNPNGNSDQWNEAYTTVQANSASWAGGGGGTVEKRFDFVTTGGIDYSYSGTAAQYTIETSPTWKLIRLTYNNNGTISNQASAINSWTGRLTATYV